jgi:internalin A
MRSSAFISYSHKDRKWLARISEMLTPLERRGLRVWSDEELKPGTLWREEIARAIADAKVAVLLVSPAFLDSEFIDQNELPPLLAASADEGLTVLWVPVDHSLYEFTDISRFQAAHNPAQPLASLPPSKLNEALVQICKRIHDAMTADC